MKNINSLLASIIITLSFQAFSSDSEKNHPAVTPAGGSAVSNWGTYVPSLSTICDAASNVYGVAANLTQRSAQYAQVQFEEKKRYIATRRDSELQKKMVGIIVDPDEYKKTQTTYTKASENFATCDIKAFSKRAGIASTEAYNLLYPGDIRTLDEYTKYNETVERFLKLNEVVLAPLIVNQLRAFRDKLRELVFGEAEKQLAAAKNWDASVDGSVGADNLIYARIIPAENQSRNIQKTVVNNNNASNEIVGDSNN